jgi:hypothetical protein
MQQQTDNLALLPLGYRTALCCAAALLVVLDLLVAICVLRTTGVAWRTEGISAG